MPHYQYASSPLTHSRTHSNVLVTTRHCRDGVTCDDTCEFAFDGTCDDGSEGDYEEYYEQYGYYRDDDLGGYAGGDGTEGERMSAGGTYEEVRV